MREKYKQGFRYARLVVKSVGWLFGWTFVVISIALAVRQVSPEIIAFLIVGLVFWGFDTLWSALDDSKRFWEEIKEHRQSSK